MSIVESQSPPHTQSQFNNRGIVDPVFTTPPKSKPLPGRENSPKAGHSTSSSFPSPPAQRRRRAHTVVLVRDPPGERLAGLSDRPELYDYSDPFIPVPLESVRGAGKPDLVEVRDNYSPRVGREVPLSYDDILQDYHDNNSQSFDTPGPSAPSLSHSNLNQLPTSTPVVQATPNEHEETGMVRRRSLQALVPSFLQGSSNNGSSVAAPPKASSPPISLTTSTRLSYDATTRPMASSMSTPTSPTSTRFSISFASRSTSKNPTKTRSRSYTTSSPGPPPSTSFFSNKERDISPVDYFTLPVRTSLPPTALEVEPASSHPHRLTTISDSLDPASPGPSTEIEETPVHSDPSRASPPPSFLLDDDPFANLSGPPVDPRLSCSGSSISLSTMGDLPAESPTLPRSPLHPELPDASPSMVSSSSSSSASSTNSTSSTPIQRPNSPPALSRAFSAGRVVQGRPAQPAYQRPAFKSRPSLPSLDTLARMNVVLGGRKPRRGKPGAGLPFEPWDTMEEVPPPLPSPPMPVMVEDSHPALSSVPESSSLASTSMSTLTVVPAASQPVSTTTSIMSTNPTPRSTSPPSNTTSTMQIVLDPDNPPLSDLLPLGQKPLLPSEIMSLGGLTTVGVVYTPDLKLDGNLGVYDANETEGDGDAATLSIPLEEEPSSQALLFVERDEDNELDSSLVTPTTVTAASTFNDPISNIQTSPNPPSSSSLVSDAETRISVDQELLAHMNGLESLLFSGDETGFDDIDHLLEGYQRGPSSTEEHDDHHTDIHSPPHQPPLSSSSNSIDDLDVEDPSSSYLSPESRSYSDLNYDYQHESDSSPYIDNYGYGYQYPDSHPYTPSLTRSSHPSSTSLSLSASLSRSLSNVSCSSQEEGELEGGDEAVQEEKQPSDGHSTHPRLLRTQSSSDESSSIQSPSADDPLFSPPLSLLPSTASSFLSKADLTNNFTRTQPRVQSPPRATPIQADTELRVPFESQSETAFSSAMASNDEFERGQGMDVELDTRFNDIEKRAEHVAVGTEMVDGVGYDSRTQEGSRYHAYASSSAPLHSSGHATSTNNGYSHHNSYFSAYRGRQGDDEEEDGRDNRRRPRGQRDGHEVEAVSRTASSSEATSSEDESTDDYGLASSSQRTLTSPISMRQQQYQARQSNSTPVSRSVSSRTHNRSISNFVSNHASTSASVPVSAFASDDEDDDDIPLAQRIPSALTAQKSIQRKVREEREQRKREKSEALRIRQTTLRPAGAAGPAPAGAMISSSRDAALAAVASASSSHPPLPPLRRRQTTQTLSRQASQPFSPEALATKLQNVQIAELIPPVQPQQLLSGPSHARSLSRGDAYQGVERTLLTTTSVPLRARSVRRPVPATTGSPSTLADPPLPSTLRPTRSFHRPTERLGESGVIPPLPSGVEPKVSRNPTLLRRPSRDHRRSPSQSRTHPSLESPPIHDHPVPPLPATARISVDEHRKIPKPLAEPRGTSPGTSFDVERPPRPSLQQQLLGNPKCLVAQQRIFIGDMQRFNMVEIGPTTTAQDAIDLIEAEGSLKGWVGSGGWMVFEVAQDFGMERPIRSFELLADVQSSWNKDKTVNYFVARLTPLSAPLERSAIPTSSPTHSGYVEWESKRGKWSKRWMQLREHGIWISKRDNRRDEVLLCSLSNFDAYQITRSHRAPKPFAFAIKSTDNLSFFEDTADYLHTFACNENDGRIWLEKILVARSYVLHQERHVLFSSKSTTGGTSGALSRSGTKKSQRSLQPLVAIPPYGGPPQLLSHHDVFEPGSLLSKQL